MTMNYKAYPTQRDAGQLLGVSETTVSRLRLDVIRCGGRDKRIRPSVVLDAAVYAIPPESVATGLIEYAREHAPEMIEQVETEVDAWLANKAAHPSVARGTLLARIRDHVTPELYESIRPGRSAESRYPTMEVMRAARIAARRPQVREAALHHYAVQKGSQTGIGTDPLTGLPRRRLEPASMPVRRRVKA